MRTKFVLKGSKMKAVTATISLAVALLATAASTREAQGTTLKRDISELNSFERILVRATHPEVYNAWNEKRGKAAGVNADYTGVDFLNIDLPTLALQMSKSGENVIKLPSLYYEFGFYFCWFGCVGFFQKFDFREPEIRNANLTRLNTKINATNIEYEFEIPDLQIVAEKFTLDDEDLVDFERTFWRGASIFITNLTIQLSANLMVVPEIGVQLSNVAMNFGVGDLRLRYENATHTAPDGTVEEWGEVESTFAEAMNAEWEQYGAEVASYIETWLNCFLVVAIIRISPSNGRNGNAECDDIVGDYVQNENFVQLLQNIGLGIAQSQKNDLVQNTNTDAEIRDHFYHLLPDFASPTINSVLLHLSTFLLQTDKFLVWAELEEVEGYIFSYDFTWENCTLGECRNVHEQMILPGFSVGGLVDDRVQLDFQPNNFSYSLKVPSVYVNSDSYQYEYSILETNHKEIYLGLQLSIKNFGVAITGDYEFKEGVGIQVSNLGLTLLVGEMQLRIPQFYMIDNGEQSAVSEFVVDAAPQIMERWREVDEDGVTFERKYEQHVQNLINSMLSDGQSIPEVFK